MTRLTWGAGDLACADTPTGDALITSAAYSYTNDDSAAAFTFGNGLVETRRQNYRGQPTQISLSSSLWSLTNDYGTATNNGNVLVQTLTAPGLSLYQKYRYDGVNRLDLAGEFTTNRSLSACPDSNSVWCQAYEFGQYGNRRVTGRTPDTTSPSEPAAYDSTNNRVTGTNWGYTDGRGNLTSMPYVGGAETFSYDAEDRLKTVNGTALKFSYDGEGRRVKRTVNGEDTVFYVYDAKGELVAEYGSAAAGGRRYVTTDHLGSTRVITNTSGGVVSRWDYLPFGEEITVSSGNPRYGITGYATASPFTLKFTGKERDSESGLDYFGARYFSGAQGRWTSPDLINLTWDRLGNPSNTLNKYVYAANNPLKFTDPDGQDVTLFYRPSTGSTDFGDYGHAFLAAYDQSTNQVEFLDYYPAGGLQRQGLEMVGPGAVNTGTFDERRSGYASLTIQTTPEITQKVMQFMRDFKANPGTYRFPTNTCVTACRAALDIAGIRVSAYSPTGLWNALYRRYSPAYRMMLADGKSFMPPISSRSGMDSGSPRTDPMAWQRFLFNLWVEQVRRQREEEERKKREREYEPPGYGR